MIGIFERAVREYAPGLPLDGQLATAALVVALLIYRASNVFGTEFHGEFVVSGGGVRNRAIMNGLAHFARLNKIRTTDELGVVGEAKEAIAFALLGAATLDGLPSNVPSATGAKRSVVLGSITSRP
jgi:anhydro-N-acetylmuramic acid kinase